MPAALADLRLTLARVGRWPRRLLAVALLLLAAVSAVEPGAAADRPRTPTRAVVVAARDLPAGHVLTDPDLRVRRWPTALAPPGRPSPRQLAGRVLAGPVTAGEPLGPTRLLDAGLVRGLPAGTVAAPLDLDQDVRGLVAPGASVDVLAVPSPDAAADPSAGPAADPAAEPAGGGDQGTGHTGPQRTGSATGGAAPTVAAAARVLAVLPPAADGNDGTRLVLAVPAATAHRLAAARTSDRFTVVLRAL